jgi:ABC-type lipoprotein release transport system permease subunit
MRPARWSGQGVLFERSTCTVTSYAVSRRRREIGIRIALGAEAVQVERFVFRQGLVAPFAGLVAGLAAALALSQIMASLVYEVS